MKKFQFRFGVIFLLVLYLVHSGCALFLLGTGAAGGYAISKDEIEGLTDVRYDRVWKSLRDVMKNQGVITLEDREQGRMDALIEGAKVEARVDQATDKTVRLRVKARKAKGFFPDIKTAQRMYTQVMKQIGG